MDSTEATITADDIATMSGKELLAYLRANKAGDGHARSKVAVLRTAALAVLTAPADQDSDAPADDADQDDTTPAEDTPTDADTAPADQDDTDADPTDDSGDQDAPTDAPADQEPSTGVAVWQPETGSVDGVVAFAHAVIAEQQAKNGTTVADAFRELLPEDVQRAAVRLAVGGKYVRGGEQDIIGAWCNAASGPAAADGSPLAKKRDSACTAHISRFQTAVRSLGGEDVLMAQHEDGTWHTWYRCSNGEACGGGDRPVAKFPTVSDKKNVGKGIREDECRACRKPRWERAAAERAARLAAASDMAQAG